MYIDKHVSSGGRVVGGRDLSGAACQTAPWPRPSPESENNTGAGTRHGRSVDFGAGKESVRIVAQQLTSTY